MSLISRYPTWLFKAVGLLEPEFPIDIDSTTIQSTYDTFQGGRGVSIVRFASFTQPASQPGGQVHVVLPPVEDHDQYLHYMTIFNGRTISTLNYILQFRDSLGPGNTLQLAPFSSVPPSTILSHAELLAHGSPVVVTSAPGFRLPMYIPVNFQLEVFTNEATGVGESTLFRMIVEDVPHGFNPNY